LWDEKDIGQNVYGSGDILYCSLSTLTKEDFIPSDCPLPDEPEKMKGKIRIENYQDSDDVPTSYYWWIDLGDTTIGSQKGYDTEAEARQDEMKWAKKLNVEVEE
jgi:hypothetical protein